MKRKCSQRPSCLGVPGLGCVRWPGDAAPGAALQGSTAGAGGSPGLRRGGTRTPTAALSLCSQAPLLPHVAREEQEICFESCALAQGYSSNRIDGFGTWRNTLLGIGLLFSPVLFPFCPVLFPLFLQKNPEEDSSGKTLSWEPGHLLLTIYTVRSIEQLLPFFNVLSQVFNSKVTSRCVGHSGSPVLYPNCFPSKDIKLENLKTFSSKARQKIEEMVEKDFLEGVIKT